MYLQTVISKKTLKKSFFVGVLKVKDENSRILSQIRGSEDTAPDPNQNVTDPHAGRGEDPFRQRNLPTTTILTKAALLLLSMTYWHRVNTSLNWEHIESFRCFA
jgi:hypothetical protein